ncbi:MAG: HNH endonuclease [Cenarchaeum symbiont of Oopsacas minuta]|nr:HNH endonuclease [Cenarchaeum symbiont of Oopsacas minuta]
MQSVLDPIQRQKIPNLLLHGLKQIGNTVKNLGVSHTGDSLQLQYQDNPVWHKKHDLDEWVALQLHLPPSLWGPKRISNVLMIQTSSELVKLRKKGIIVDWSSTKRTMLFRLVDPNISIDMPTMSTKIRKPMSQDGDMSMRTIFLSIISKSRKDNTYKFALGKTLLDYCKNNLPTGQTKEIKYEYLANEFLRHYWYQRYKFKIKQDFHIKKRPMVIQILEDAFGDKPPYKFKHLDQNKIKQARNGILENVFGEARKKKGMVVQRFQRITCGNSVADANVFYDYDDDAKKIFLKPEAHEFFRQNYGLLMRALLAEWIKYLERVNHGLPMLAAKVDNEEAERGSLTKYKKVFLGYSDHCFYCNNQLIEKCIHVDHFIPWSYIFDDNAWNLVLSCKECNLKKSSSLPEEKYVDNLIGRDQKYSKTMELMEKSLYRLSLKGLWENEIQSHYKICHEYGFGRWILGK